MEFNSMMEFVKYARPYDYPTVELEQYYGGQWRVMDGWEWNEGVWGWMNKGYPALMPNDERVLHSVVQAVDEKIEELARANCGGCQYSEFSAQKHHMRGCMDTTASKVKKYFWSAVRILREQMGERKMLAALPGGDHCSFAVTILQLVREELLVNGF